MNEWTQLAQTKNPKWTLDWVAASSTRCRSCLRWELRSPDLVVLIFMAAELEAVLLGAFRTIRLPPSDDDSWDAALASGEEGPSELFRNSSSAEKLLFKYTGQESDDIFRRTLPFLISKVWSSVPDRIILCIGLSPWGVKSRTDILLVLPCTRGLYTVVSSCVELSWVVVWADYCSATEGYWNLRFSN